VWPVKDAGPAAPVQLVQGHATGYFPPSFRSGEHSCAQFSTSFC